MFDRNFTRIPQAKFAPKGYTLCPGCSTKAHLVKNRVAVTGQDLYICPKCMAIFGKCTMDYYREHICSGRWAKGELPYERHQWFFVDTPKRYYHGVRDSATNDLIQSG